MPDKQSENRGPVPGREDEGERRPPGKPSREIERETMSEGESNEVFERVLDLEVDVELEDDEEITQRNPRVGVDDEPDNRNRE